MMMEKLVIISIVKNPGNQQKVIYDDDVVYVAMPPSLQTAYGPAYKRMDIGVSGLTMTQMLDSGKDMTNMAEKFSRQQKQHSLNLVLMLLLVLQTVSTNSLVSKVVLI